MFGCLLRITYTDDSNETITSTTQWRQSRGKVVSDDMFKGEIHDGRLAQPDWFVPQFNGEEGWSSCRLL